MDFKDKLFLAKCGDEVAFGEILNMYRPLLMKESIINGVLDEDLYQELCIVLIRCIQGFKL